MRNFTGDEKQYQSYANVKIHTSLWKREVKNLFVSKTYVIEADKTKLFLLLSKLESS